MASTPTPEPHEVLGVAKDADAATIRRAYNRLMKTAHPDRGGTAGMFRLVQDAFDALSSSGSRPAPRASSSPPEPPPSRPSSAEGDYRRSERERIDAEFKRRRRQAYLDYPNDPWLAEFTARDGEEDRASPLDDYELMNRLEEMMRRGMNNRDYPMPEFWANNMQGAGAAGRRQQRLRDDIKGRKAWERKAAEEKQREDWAARLRAQEDAMGPGFVKVADARRELLALWMFRSETARAISTVRLKKLKGQINALRVWPLVLGLGTPALAWLVLIADVTVVSVSDRILGSEQLAFTLTGLCLFCGWIPPVIAYLIYRPNVAALIRRAAAGGPYLGEEEDRQAWLDAHQRARTNRPHAGVGRQQ